MGFIGLRSLNGEAEMSTLVRDNKEGLPPEYLWLEGRQPYVVCAFYTPDYLRHVLALKRSLETLGVNHFFKCYEPAASWEATTRIKPRFIEECLTRLETKHVLYIDADAVLRETPAFLDEVATDVALWPKARKKRGSWRVRVTANTIYVRNTPGGRRFVRAWREAEQVCGVLAVDGDMLQVAVTAPGVTFTVLPSLEPKIGDGRSGPFVEQFHVSQDTFKWRRAFRRARRIAAIAGLAVFLASGFYLLLSS
jgi:hypothetical protein